MKKYLMVVAVLAVSSSVMAANEEKFAVKLDETIVSAESFGTSVLETPKNVTVITSEDIERRGAQTIEEALKVVPGLTAFSNIGGSDAKISFRGMAPGKEEQNILFLIDGIPYNSMVDTAGVNLNLIPVDTIERIEVVPNGGNVLYGEGAVAGVINIITKEGKNKKYYGTVGYERGSYDLKKYKVNVGSQITDRLSLNVNYLNKEVENYRKHDTRDVEYADFNSKYKFDNGTLTLGFTHSETESRFPGKLTKTQIDEGQIKPSTGSTKGKEKLKIYRGKYETTITDNLQFSIAGDYKDKLYNSINEKTGATSTVRDTQSFYITPQIKYQYMDNSYFIVGGDFSKGKSEYVYTTSTSTDTKRESLGVFATNKTRINDFIFTQGYRHQKIKYDVTDRLYPSKGHTLPKTVDETFSENAYELTGSYLLNESSSIYLTYNRAFRAPTADEAGRWRPGYDVEMQTSDTFELGLKAVWNNLYFSGAIFQTDTDNEIFYVAYENGKLGTTYNLPGKNRRRGIELSMEQYFDKITFREGFSYVEHEIKSGPFSGNEIPGVSNYIYNLGMDYSILDNLIFNTSFYYYGSAYAAYDFHNNLGRQEGHTELNVSLSYKMENGLTLYGGINNLLDKEYFNAKAGSDGKTLDYYYGTRRNYYVGFKYSF